jgi:hypothetical protein
MDAADGERFDLDPSGWIQKKDRLIDAERKLYEANLQRRHSTLWEARYLNGVAQLTKGLDAPLFSI